MAYLFASVTEVGADRIVLRVDDREIGLTLAQLQALGAADLSPGARVRVTLSDERITAIKVVQVGLVAPARATPSGPPPEPPAAASDDAGARVWREGDVVEIGAYWGKLRTDAAAVVSFRAADFASLALEGGDRVLFATPPGTDEVVDMRVVARAVAGVGAENPCAAGLDALLDGSESPPIKALVRALCEGGRLAWYWRTPATQERSEPAADHLSPELLAALREGSPGLARLYRHQVDALAALKQGRDIVVLTPTASGKTNCYNPAVLDALLGDPTATALYVFPLNALLNDQLAKLEALQRGAQKSGRSFRIGRLIGGMGEAKREAILKQPPNIIVTNPEMLSWVLGKYESHQTRRFFERLRFVVLDEAHFYRGVLGLHMAGIVRRLRLACRRSGNADPGPRFVLSSATVGRPEDLATDLTGIDVQRFHLITRRDNGRGDPQRNWMMLDPYAGGVTGRDAHLEQAVGALTDALLQGGPPLRAILFVRSFREIRDANRLLARQLQDRGRGDLASQVATYAGGLLSPEEKSERYGDFKAGRLRALISTNALEAGIDLGDLDLCILAGFPNHVMRMRQMAGRAGRRNEGAVIFVPDLTRSADRYYADAPRRLLTQPEEAFVVDPHNRHIARRHLAQACASFRLAMTREELGIFGRHRDRILEDGARDEVLQQVMGESFLAGDYRPAAWLVDRIRGAEQNAWHICLLQDGNPCEHPIQTLDRQYVYREAHPGAVFESIDGDLYRCVSLDEATQRVYARPIDPSARERTFPLEDVSVRFGREEAHRDLAGGATLVWGEATVTRTCFGYGEYALIPRRRCRRCGATSEADTTCQACGGRTVPFLDRTEPKYESFDKPITIELETIACRLELPAGVEDLLRGAAPCPIREPEHKVAEFLEARPAYRDSADLARASGLSAPAAQIAFDYYTTWTARRSTWPRGDKRAPLFPSVYGQCLCHALRAKLPEDQALSAFQTATGYPAVSDSRHICRACFGGVLLLAAHTLEHIVMAAYPTVALGDSQDLGSSTMVIHPQTGRTTVAWYDLIEGGIGAAEKVFEQFEALIRASEASRDCECRADSGCPRCIQVPRCDRDNEGLSKIAAINLARVLLGMPEFVPADPEFVARAKAGARAEAARAAEYAGREVPRPGAAAPGIDPFALLRVQPHVHDDVLARAVETRGEEIAGESPPVSIRALQEAYAQIQATPRPTNWDFDPAWDGWQTLHVLKSASGRLVQRAYRAIAKAIHPDVWPGDKAKANEMLKQVNDAWEKTRKSRAGNDG